MRSVHVCRTGERFNSYTMEVNSSLTLELMLTVLENDRYKQYGH